MKSIVARHMNSPASLLRNRLYARWRSSYIPPFAPSWPSKALKMKVPMSNERDI